MAMTRSQMKKWLLIALALLAFGGLKGGLAWYWYTQQRDAPPSEVSCTDLAAGCPLGDGTVLRFVTPARHAKPFTVEIAGPAEAPAALFDMQGMEMGVTRYRFQPAGERRWRAEVMLPVCISGSQAWLAQVETGGKRYRVGFVAGT